MSPHITKLQMFWDSTCWRRGWVNSARVRFCLQCSLSLWLSREEAVAFPKEQSNLHCHPWLFYFTSRSYLTVTRNWKGDSAMTVMLLCYPCAYFLSLWLNECWISWYKVKEFHIKKWGWSQLQKTDMICTVAVVSPQLKDKNQTQTYLWALLFFCNV